MKIGSPFMSMDDIGEALRPSIEEGIRERQEFEDLLNKLKEKEADDRRDSEPCNSVNSRRNMSFENGKPKFRIPDNRPAFRQGR
jgi:hypothetical protein